MEAARSTKLVYVLIFTIAYDLKKLQQFENTLVIFMHEQSANMVKRAYFKNCISQKVLGQF